MQNTANYQLPTWEQDDQIKMSDFNSMTAKLDAALKSSADALTAEAAAREAADSAKADAAALAAEASAREAADSALQAALTAAVGTTGCNCRALMGSYDGTGAAGSGAPITLVTGFTPLVLVLSTDGGTHIRIRRADSVFSDADFSDGATTVQMTWGADRVSWYSSAATSRAARQASESGKTYHYLVLGYDA